MVVLTHVCQTNSISPRFGMKIPLKSLRPPPRKYSYAASKGQTSLGNHQKPMEKNASFIPAFSRFPRDHRAKVKFGHISLLQTINQLQMEMG